MGWHCVLPPGLVLWIFDGYIKAAVRFTSAQTECLNITETQFGLFWKCSHFLPNEFHMPYAAQHNWSIDNFIREVKLYMENYNKKIHSMNCNDYTELWELIFDQNMHFRLHDLWKHIDVIIFFITEDFLLEEKYYSKWEQDRSKNFSCVYGRYISMKIVDKTSGKVLGFLIVSSLKYSK